MAKTNLLMVGAATLIVAVLALAIFIPAPRAAAGTAPDFKVAFTGDQGNNANALAVMALIKNEGAELTLLNGDFDYGDDPEAWDANINSVLGEDYPLLGEVGNHDTTSWPGYQDKLEARIARNPELDCHGEIGVQSYCYYKGVLFILSGVGTMEPGGIPTAAGGVVPDVSGSSELVPKTHEAYIRDLLEHDTSIWRICNWHKNQEAMQVGGKGDEVGWLAFETCREGGAPIMMGHEHSYERTKTLVDMTNQLVDPDWSDPNELRVTRGSTFAVVSGVAGEGVRNQLRCLDGAGTVYPYGCNGEWAMIDTKQQGATFGALFCTFSPGGIEYLASCYYKDIQGRIRDTFTIVSELHGVPPPVEDIVLTTDSYKVRGANRVDLTWTGIRSTNVDVLRDGQKIATSYNDGEFTDKTGGKGSRTYHYQVCEAGTGRCSEIATVEF
jgi:hypothetical protein